MDERATFRNRVCIDATFSTGTFPRANARPAPGLYDRFSPAPSSIPLTVAIALAAPHPLLRRCVRLHHWCCVVISESGFTGLRVNGVRPASKHANCIIRLVKVTGLVGHEGTRDPSVGNTRLDAGSRRGESRFLRRQVTQHLPAHTMGAFATAICCVKWSRFSVLSSSPSSNVIL